MMKKLLSAILIGTILICIGMLSGCGSDEGNENAGEVTGTCTLTVQDVCENKEMDVHEGESVLDILQAADIPVVCDNTGNGMEIEAINGVEEEGDTGWMFYVNGEMPMEYSDRITVNDGDSIEWKFGSYEDMQLEN